MEVLSGIVNFITTYIFNQPFILLSLVAMLGLILQKKPLQDIIVGSLKTGIGYLILSQGTSLLAGIVTPIASILNKIFHVEASTTGMGQVAFEADWASSIALIMVVGFIVNLLLARFTKFKYVYLTAHQTYFIALVYLALAVEVVANPSKTMFVIVGGILLGVYCTLSPALVQPFMRKVTGSNDLAYGHTTSFGVIMGALVGKLFKKHENESSESLKIPAKLSFLKDITVSTAIIMTLLYLVGVTAAGPAWVQENVSGGTAAYMYAISQGVMFGVGITIVLTGVSMMIAENYRGLQGYFGEGGARCGACAGLPRSVQLCPHGRDAGLFELPWHGDCVRGAVRRCGLLCVDAARNYLLLWRRPCGRVRQLYRRLARRRAGRCGGGPDAELRPGAYRRLPAHHHCRLRALVQRLRLLCVHMAVPAASEADFLN